jgi:hypothetical protein
MSRRNRNLLLCWGPLLFSNRFRDRRVGIPVRTGFPLRTGARILPEWSDSLHTEGFCTPEEQRSVLSAGNVSALEGISSSSLDLRWWLRPFAVNHTRCIYSRCVCHREIRSARMTLKRARARGERWSPEGRNVLLVPQITSSSK